MSLEIYLNSQLIGQNLNWCHSARHMALCHIAQSVFNAWQFQWYPNVIKYLGLSIPRAITQMIVLNFNRPLHEIWLDLDKFVPLGKVNRLERIFFLI